MSYDFDPSFFSARNLAQNKNVPALTPPAGVVPNFAAHNGRAELYIILCAILLAMVYALVSLRLYAKLWINHSAGLDDGKGTIAS